MVTTASAITTTALAAPSTPTTAAPSTTSPSLAAPPTSTAVASPEDAARALYDAWARADRAAADRSAQPAAVGALFARPWRAADGWSFTGCTGAAGSLVCTWQSGDRQLLMRVLNAPATVAEVRFQP